MALAHSADGNYKVGHWTVGPTMRDITNDLKERLSAVEEQGKAENLRYERDRKALDEQHNTRLADLKAEWETINRLLVAEQRRLGVSPETPAQPKPKMSLDDFFVQVAEKFGTASKQNLREEAEHAGYFVDGGPNGRRTHATIMNIVRSGRLREIEPDVYAPGHKHGEFNLDQHMRTP